MHSIISCVVDLCAVRFYRSAVFCGNFQVDDVVVVVVEQVALVELVVEEETGSRRTGGRVFASRGSHD